MAAAQPITIFGRTFPSHYACADHYKIHTETMRRIFYAGGRGGVEAYVAHRMFEGEYYKTDGLLAYKLGVHQCTISKWRALARREGMSIEDVVWAQSTRVAFDGVRYTTVTALARSIRTPLQHVVDLVRSRSDLFNPQPSYFAGRKDRVPPQEQAA